MMVLPLSLVSHNDVALAVSQDDGTFREDGHGGPVVRHHHCAAFTIRQHHNALDIPVRDDVAIRAKHRALTVCGFDDGVALLINSKDISLPIGQHHVSSASPAAMMLPPESSTAPEPSVSSTMVFNGVALLSTVPERKPAGSVSNLATT